MPSKFVVAMCVYAVLGVIGAWVLDGKIRLGTLIVLGYFAVRTVIAQYAGWTEK